MNPLTTDILFHRYFQGERVLASNGDFYRGAQDLEQLPPTLCELWSGIKTTLNEGLLRQHGKATAGEHPRYQFDFIDSTAINAMAVDYEGIAFIGVTMPLNYLLWESCERLSITPEIAMRFNAETTEQRQALHVELFSTVLGFVVGHEYGHHTLGHHVHRSEAMPFYNDVINLTANGSIEDHAKEIHADGLSVYLVIHGLVIGDRRELTIKNLGPQTTDEALLYLFIVSVAAFFFIGGPAPFDPQQIGRLTHPPSAIRLNYIMRHVERWCTESRPSLLPALTPALFQEILWTVEEVTWGRKAPAWPEQDIFARSPEGQSYMLKLNAAYDRLQALNRTRKSV